MSSPKRAAKGVRKRVTNAPRRPAPSPRKPQAKAAEGASAEAKRLAALIERGIADGRLDILTADALQALLAASCRVYTARREAGEELAPVARKSVSATDVMVTASGLLRAADLAAFELGVWQGFTGR
jgi:hypothetical protein